MPLLPEGTAVLLELPLWVPDLRPLPAGEQMGHDERSDLDLSGLRQDPDDGVGLLEMVHEGAVAVADFERRTVPQQAFHVT